MKIKNRSFKNAKKFVQQLGLTDKKDWLRFTNSGTMPPDIPKNPEIAYKKSWKSWSDFLGSSTYVEKLNTRIQKRTTSNEHEEWRRQQMRMRWRQRMIDRRQEKPEFYDKIHDLKHEKKWKEILKITKPKIGTARLVGNEHRPRKDEFYLRNHVDALMSLGKPKEALPFTIEIARRSPDDEEGWLHLSFCYDKLGQPSEALAAIESAIEIDPTSKLSWYNKACMLARLNKKDKALRSLLIAAALGKDEVILDMRTDKDFDKIRNDPKFKKIVSSHWKDLF